METLENFEITKETVDNVYRALIHSDLPQFSDIFLEAIQQMEYNSEMLWDFLEMYRGYLAGSEMWRWEADLSSTYFCREGDERRLARLFNEDRPLVHCHMFSMLAIEICLEIYNKIEVQEDLIDQEAEEQTHRHLDLLCQASEAVALARLSSATIELYYDGEEKNEVLAKTLESAEKRHKPLRKWNQKHKEKRSNTVTLAIAICQKIWETHPSARLGTLAQLIHLAISDKDTGILADPENGFSRVYGKVKLDVLRKHLNKQFPSRSSRAGRPTLEDQANEAKLTRLVNKLVLQHPEAPPSAATPV